MKKLIATLLVLCFALGLCACGGKKADKAAEPQPGETYMKVLFSDGTSETFGVGDLAAMAKNDTETYNTKYAGNKIEMSTTVTKVELDYEMLGFVRVSFEGGWICYIRKGTPVIDEIERGTKVDVTATLIKDASNLVGATLYGATITVK